MTLDGKKPVGLVAERIHEVWAGKTDFDEYGLRYVAFLIEQDVQDMHDADFLEGECIPELADVCINAMRMMMERGYSPSDEILKRLDDHEAKGQDELIERYTQRYGRIMSEREETVTGEVIEQFEVPALASQWETLEVYDPGEYKLVKVDE